VEEQFSERGNVIESSAGFSVAILGRVGLRYSEGTRSAWINSEILAIPGVAIFMRSTRTWEGPDGGEISAEDKDRIVTNIKRAFEACGYELHVAEPVDWSGVAMRPPGERHK
jgi:hypothetical protein